ncbi:MAG: hypothetical protein ACTSUR_01910 [Candidatus Heimdallarchaeaceae archaeon]
MNIVKLKYANVSETIFCPYKEDCVRICKQDISLGGYEELFIDTPFYDKEVAKTRSIKGMEKWFEKRKKLLKPNYRDGYALIEINKLSLTEPNKDKNKQILKK